MRYPNLRYGNPTELRHYAMAFESPAALARYLKRSERTVNDWLSGASRVPWWVPELLRLRKWEHDQRVYQMTGRASHARLGVVDGSTVVDAGHRFITPEPLPEIPSQADLFTLRKA